MTFYVWKDIIDPNDSFGIYASVNGANFSGPTFTGQEKRWVRYAVDLSDLAGAGNVLDQEEVWIAFHFKSNPSKTSAGVWIDDVTIMLNWEE